MLKYFKKYKIGNPVRVVLGKDFEPCSKRYKGPKMKNMNFLVF